MSELLPVRQIPRSKLPRSIIILTTIAATASVIFAIVFGMVDFFFFFPTDRQLYFLEWDLSRAVEWFFDGAGYYFIFFGAIWSGIFYSLSVKGWLSRRLALFLTIGTWVMLAIFNSMVVLRFSPTEWMFALYGVRLYARTAGICDLVFLGTIWGCIFWDLRDKGLLSRRRAIVLAMGTSATFLSLVWIVNSFLFSFSPIHVYEIGVDMPSATRWMFDRNGYCLILLGAIWSGIFCRWTYRGLLSQQQALILTSGTVVLTLAYGAYVLLAFFAPLLIPINFGIG